MMKNIENDDDGVDDVRNEDKVTKPRYYCD